MLRIWAWSPSSTVAMSALLDASGQALFEQGALGGVAGQAEGALVRLPGLGRAAEFAQQFGAGRMIEVISIQVSGERVGLVEGGLGSEHPTEGDGPVQPDHREGNWHSNASYRSRICAQSVASQLDASAWQATMAAWIW
jgi:hypothetical protein